MNQSKRTSNTNYTSNLCHDKKLNTNATVVLNKIAPETNEVYMNGKTNSSSNTTNNYTKKSYLNNSNKDVKSDQVDQVQFFSACTLENLKQYVKQNKLNMRNSDDENQIENNATTTTDSPKYNTRSNSMNSQKTSTIIASNIKSIVKSNELNKDSEYLNKLDDNTTSCAYFDEYDLPISNDLDSSLSQKQLLNDRARSRRKNNYSPHIIWQPQIKTTANSKQKSKQTSKLELISSRSSSSRSSSSSSEMRNMKLLPECGKAHCRLGCICEALQATGNNNTNMRGSISSNSGRSSCGSNGGASGGSSRQNTSINNTIYSSSNNNDLNSYRDHCGRFECMFECTCTRRLRSTTRLMRQTSTNSDNNHSSGNTQKSNNKNNKNNTKKSKQNRSLNCSVSSLSTKKSKNNMQKTDQKTKRSSSQSSNSSELSKVQSSDPLSQQSSSGEEESKSNNEESSQSLATSSQESSGKNNANKLRKSKRVKHLIKRAAASLSSSNRNKTHHSSNQKFEDNYYYYYYNNNSHQPVNKNNAKTKAKEIPSNGNNTNIKIENVTENEREINISSQLKKSMKNKQLTNRIEQKHKLNKILTKLNKKTENSNLKDKNESLGKITTLKNFVNKENSVDDINLEESIYDSISNNPINGDNKENLKKNFDKTFKPYTQNIILQIQVKTDNLSFSEIQTKSLPLHIEIYTSKWCDKNSRKILRLTAKLLQQLGYKADKMQPKWKELEFDYENELTVKIYASSRVSSKRILQFRAEESSDEIEYVKQIDMCVYNCKRENTQAQLANKKVNELKSKFEQKLFNSIEDILITYGSASTILIDLKANESSVDESNIIDNNYKDSSKKLLESLIKNENSSINTNQLSIGNNSSSKFTKYKTDITLRCNSSKSLPRLLCRNRSFNDSSVTKNSSAGSNQTSNLNQTGILLKKVDSLFEKIKSSPTLDPTTANLLSKIVPTSVHPLHTKISPHLLEFRPNTNFNTSNFNMASLFIDEQIYFNARNKISYDLYNPFSDKKLILNLYNTKNNTRFLVDTVCTIVNNMVNVVSITHNQKNRNKASFTSKPSLIDLTITPTKIPDTNVKTISNKTVSILPNLNTSLQTNKSQILNTILSKPSVIILNNKNLSQNNSIDGEDSAKKNPFITAVKNNSNFTLQSKNIQQQQVSPKDFQYKTIVKLISANDIINSSSQTLSSNKMVKVTSNIAPLIPNTYPSNEIKSYQNHLLTPKFSTDNNNNNNELTTLSVTSNSSSTTTRPLILKSISQTLKSAPLTGSNTLRLGNSGGFVPIRPKETIPLLTSGESRTLSGQKIIKLTNGSQIKCLNSTDLLNNLKTSSQISQANTSTNLSVINCKLTSETISVVENNQNINTENRKRKRKQDLSVIPRIKNEKTNISSNDDHGLILTPYKNNIEKSLFNKAKKRDELKVSKKSFYHQASPFKVSASLFKFKKYANNDNSSTHTNKNHNDANGDDVDDFDDDDFLDDGISEDDNDDFNSNLEIEEQNIDYENQNVKEEYFGSDDEDYWKSRQGSQLIKEHDSTEYKIVNLSHDSLTSMQQEASSASRSTILLNSNKRLRSRKTTNPNHKNFEHFHIEEHSNQQQLDEDFVDDVKEENENIETCSKINFNENQFTNSKQSVNKIESKLNRNKNLTNQTNSNIVSSSFKLKSDNNNNVFNNNNCNDDSFDSSNDNKQLSNNMSLSISSNESDGLDDEESFFESQANEYDLETDDLIHVTYPKLHISKKPVSNSLHSIKERERRDTLKKLFSKLKLSMFKLTFETNTSYYEDSNMKNLKEELNCANLNPRMKSKQRTLLEAVQNIHVLESTEKNLLLILEQQKQYNSILNERFNKLKQP